MNVLIIDDHIALLEGVESYLKNNHLEINNIRTAPNGKEALRLFNNTTNFDVVITDLNMPEMNGIDFIRLVKQKIPQLKIIVLTMYYNKGLVERLKANKIDAFLTKSTSLTELSEALNHLSKNKTYVSSSIKELFSENQFEIDEETIITDDFSKIYSLSPREIDVLNLMMENCSNNEMAGKLFVGAETIKSHRKNIYRKLGVNNVLDLYKLLVANKYFKKNET